MLQGEQLSVISTLRNLQAKYEHITVPIRYSFLDEGKNIIFAQTRNTLVTDGAVIRESFPIPLYMMPGKYFVQAEIIFDGTSVSRTAPFLVKELPLIKLSSGATISYADVIRNLGWTVFSFLSAAFSWLFLFIREFGLYLRGSAGVTIRDLRKAGYVRK